MLRCTCKQTALAYPPPHPPPLYLPSRHKGKDPNVWVKLLTACQSKSSNHGLAIANHHQVERDSLNTSTNQIPVPVNTMAGSRGVAAANADVQCFFANAVADLSVLQHFSTPKIIMAGGFVEQLEHSPSHT